MRYFFDHRRALRRNWLLLVGVSLCVYFSYFLVQGDRSYTRLMGMKIAVERETKALSAMTDDRMKLEQKVTMLRPGSINPDYLEERARIMLGYRAPDDMDLVSRK
jgi:cell division protein FtsB